MVSKPLSVGEVASILRVSKPSVLNWINSGALKAFTTYGGHHRIWPADLKTLIDKTGMDIEFEFVDERSHRILVIDDDPEYTNLLKQIVKSELPNVEVISTDDGYDALMRIGELRPQLMILDIRMPKLDGFKVLQLLTERKLDWHMKILVVSGFLDTETREALKNTVADVWTEKSTDAPSMITTIGTLLGGHLRENRRRVSAEPPLVPLKVQAERNLRSPTKFQFH
ncbi:MAG: response regulator [Ignavibacteriae bacterium]|nr:response regulator [Ignavibacteriota bacterium]